MSTIDLVQGAAVFADATRFSFARNVATCDELGIPVAANTPRFGQTVTVAGQLGPAETVLSGLGANPYVFTGYDADGSVMAVAVETSASTRRTRVMTEDSPGSNVWTTRNDFLWSKPTSGAGLGGTGDIRGLVGTANDDGLCYIPKAWTILHGTIIAFCEIYFRTAGSGTVWTTAESRGCGFAVSTDYGVTWYVYDDVAANFNPGKTRGTGWSMCGYWTPFQEAGQPFVEAWICACDYQFAGASPPPAANPHGGTVYWFKLTRANESDRFVPVNTAAVIKVGRDNLEVTSVDQSLKYCQRQGVALARDLAESDSLVVIVAESDSRYSGETKITGIDRDDYDTGFVSQKNWHGFRDTSIDLNSGHDTFTGNMTAASAVISVASLGATWGNKLHAQASGNGTVVRVAGAGAAGVDLTASVLSFNEGAGTITLNANASTNVTGATCTIQARGDYATGNQFVASCQGPEPGEIILGGDAVVGTVDIVQANDAICVHRRAFGGHTDERSSNDATLTTPDYERWGLQRTFAGQLKIDRPERATRVVVAIMDRATQMQGTAGPIPANINVLLISRDSGRAGSWAVIQCPDNPDFTPNAIGLHIAGEYLYSSTADAIKRYRLPGVVSGQPLLISPGVANYMHDNFGGTNGMYDSDTPNNAMRCPKVNGKFQRVAMTGDGSGQVAGTALGDLDPQPPIQHDPSSSTSGNVYRVRYDKVVNGTSLPLASASNTVATFPIVTRGNDAEFVGTIGWGAAFTGWYKVRTFMFNASHLAESVPIARGKAPCNSYVQLRSNPYSGGAVAFTGPTWQQCSNDCWDSVSFNRQVTSAWNTNAGGGSAMLLQILQGSSTDKETSDFYVAFDQFSLNKGDYGYPAPRAVAGATASNTIVVPTTKIDEVASLSKLGLGGGASFTFIATGVVPKHAWDHFTYRDATDTEWPIMTLFCDADNYARIAPSPWSSTSSTNVIDREGRLLVAINDGGAATIKEQTGATFLRDESLVVAIRFDAETGTVTIDSVIAGQRMATQTYSATDWAGKTFDSAKFSNEDGSVVASFGWLRIFAENVLLSDAAMTTHLMEVGAISGLTLGQMRQRGAIRNRNMRTNI